MWHPYATDNQLLADARDLIMHMAKQFKPLKFCE